MSEPTIPGEPLKSLAGTIGYAAPEPPFRLVLVGDVLLDPHSIIAVYRWGSSLRAHLFDVEGEVEISGVSMQAFADAVGRAVEVVR